MELKDLSICFITEKVKACTAFYQEHFSGKVTFDCGWYVNLEFGDSGRSLQFKEPQGEEKPFAGHGITLNIKVTDVNAVHNRLMSRGLKEVDSLEDHPGVTGAFR